MLKSALANAIKVKKIVQPNTLSSIQKIVNATVTLINWLAIKLQQLHILIQEFVLAHVQFLRQTVYHQLQRSTQRIVLVTVIRLRTIAQKQNQLSIKKFVDVNVM